jgi:hypothetical protein
MNEMKFSSDDLVRLSLLLDSIVGLQDGLQTTLAVLEQIDTVLVSIHENALPVADLLCLVADYGLAATAKLQAEAMANDSE